MLRQRTLLFGMKAEVQNTTKEPKVTEEQERCSLCGDDLVETEKPDYLERLCDVDVSITLSKIESVRQ